MKSDDIYRGHNFSPVQRCIGRRSRTTIPIPEDLLMAESLDSTVIHSAINRRRAAAKLQYDKHTQPPL